MKGIVLAGVILLSGWAYGDYVEVKDAYGKSSYSTYSPKLYVCYNERVKVISEGTMYLSYRGCTRESIPCANLGKVHFGKYPNSRQAANALWRCRNSRPRFVD
jgi:hypothetical protein